MKFMNRTLPALLLLLAGCASASAQKITPPNGYYPASYNGDAWRGRVVKTDERARTITLSSVRGKEKQTFVGVVEKGYLVRYSDKSIRPLIFSKIPLGARITVLYEQRTRKINGRKVHYNLIIDMIPYTNRKRGYRIFRPYR